MSLCGGSLLTAAAAQLREETRGLCGKVQDWTKVKVNGRRWDGFWEQRKAMKAQEPKNRRGGKAVTRHSREWREVKHGKTRLPAKSHVVKRTAQWNSKDRRPQGREVRRV
ncbi:hypothetical protein TRVL_03363 [Trypanosoma vivax]|nr:hypothetical protein TRVL_03363 [Trypanosoma vivax]